MAETGAVCRFCGQTVMIMTSGLPPEGEALEEAAIKACGCPEACGWKAMQRFAENLHEIVGPGSRKSGFRGEVHEDAIKLIMEAANCIYKGYAMRVTITLSPADRVTIEEKKDVLTATRREVREMS